MFSGMSVVAIVLAPQMDMMNRFLDTVPLTTHQWTICIVAALAAPAVTEIRKLVLRRRNEDTPPAQTPSPTPETTPQPAAG
jgi:hypothetical protein